MAKKVDAKMGALAKTASSGKLVNPRPINGNNGQVTSSSNWPKKSK